MTASFSYSKPLVQSMAVVIFSFILGIGFFAQEVQAQTSGKQPAKLAVTAETVAGEIVVRIKGEYGGDHSQKIFKNLKGRVRIRKSLPGLNIHHLKVTSGESEADLIAELNSSSHVQYAEPNYVIHLTQTDQEETPVATAISEGQILSAGEAQIMTVGNEGSYSQSSAATQVTQSWSSVTGNSTVVVAVLDTGTDYTHYVMTGTSSIWTNKNEIANNGIDDDGNGFIDDVRGWNFAYNTNDPMDDNGHGTHVAGIVLGVSQNILAGSLMASNIQIMPIKFMDSSGTGTTAAAVAGVYYAIANGAKVLNNSWGGSGYSQSLNDVFNYAYNHGLFIASAAGNYSSNDDAQALYPASLVIPSQLAVAATDNYDNLASFSSYGRTTVQVAAPGVSILSTYPGNSFAYLSGTSMATPMVSGIAAQILHESPQLTGYQVAQVIKNSVNIISGLSSYVGTSGRVNALSAVQSANSQVSTQAYQPVFNEVIPANVPSSTTSQSAGCGTIASGGGLSTMFWSNTGGSGGASPGALGSLLGILLLPLFTWVVVRTRLAKPYRRRFERFSVDSEVKLNLDGQEMFGRLATISLGGASFVAPVNDLPEMPAGLRKGELITLQIKDPQHSEPIQIMGKIVWSKDSQAFGVEFGPLGDHLLAQLQVWTRRLVPA